MMGLQRDFHPWYIRSRRVNERGAVKLDGRQQIPCWNLTPFQECITYSSYRNLRFGNTLFQRSRVKFQGVTFLKSVLHESKFGKLHFWSAASMQIANLIQSLSSRKSFMPSSPPALRVAERFYLAVLSAMFVGAPRCEGLQLVGATKVKMFRGILHCKELNVYPRLNH